MCIPHGLTSRRREVAAAAALMMMMVGVVGREAAGLCLDSLPASGAAASKLSFSLGPVVCACRDEGWVLSGSRGWGTRQEAARCSFLASKR